MVYLIGVNHIVQHLNRQADANKRVVVDEFMQHLLAVAQKYSATIIAEEFSIDAFLQSNAEVAIAQAVAEKLGITHLFCDPTRAERKNLGIAKDNHYRREEYWLRCIASYKGQDIIFICGYNHLESFEARLKRHGFVTKIVSCGWGDDYSPTI